MLVLDRGELTSGSTFHSAGLVGQLRSTIALTRINMASVELYRRLRDDTGLDPGWRQVGSLRLASSSASVAGDILKTQAAAPSLPITGGPTYVFLAGAAFMAVAAAHVIRNSRRIRAGASK